MAINPLPPHHYNDGVFYNTHHFYNEKCGPTGDEEVFTPVYTALLDPIDTCPQAEPTLTQPVVGPCMFGNAGFGDCGFGG